MLEFWRDKRVLLTGHTGFKGTWLALWLHKAGAKVTGLALPPENETDLYRVARVDDLIDSHMVDLRDREAVGRCVGDADPEIVIHMAAQALVLPGYQDPVGTYATNVMGTAHLLDALREAPNLQAVSVVTSDKVYANPGTGIPLREEDPLGGNDPYSSSKGCAEILTRCWDRSFLAERGVQVVTGRAGNVIGGGDLAPYRLVPDIWRAFEKGEAVILRNPESTRPWQFVLDPLSGYLMQVESVLADPESTPKNLNFGPTPEDVWPVGKVVDTAISILGKGAWERESEKTPAEAPLLTLDSSLARKTIGRSGRLAVEPAVRWTFEWWNDMSEGADPRELCLGQIARYEQLPLLGTVEG